MASKRFVKLERHVEREYERKGYSRTRALRIGRAVAGKVAHRKPRQVRMTAHRIHRPSPGRHPQPRRSPKPTQRPPRDSKGRFKRR